MRLKTKDEINKPIPDTIATVKKMYMTYKKRRKRSLHKKDRNYLKKYLKDFQDLYFFLFFRMDFNLKQDKKRRRGKRKSKVLLFFPQMTRRMFLYTT